MLQVVVEFVGRDGRVVLPEEAALDALAARYVVTLLRSAFPGHKVEITAERQCAMMSNSVRVRT